MLGFDDLSIFRGKCIGVREFGHFRGKYDGIRGFGHFFQGNVLVFDDLGIYYSRIESPIYPPLRSLKLELI